MAEVGVKRRKRDWGPGGTDRTLRQAREESVTALLAKTDKGKPRPLMWKLLVSYVVDKGPLIQRLTAFVKLWVKNGLGEDDYEFLEDFLNAYGSFMVDATQELTLRERCWRYIEWNAFMGVAEIADPDHPESCTPSEGRGISDRHAVKAASDAFLYALKGDDTIGGYGASPNDSPLLKGVGQHVHSVVADILWTQMSKPEQLIDILTCDDDVEGDAEESEFAAQMGKTGSVGGEDSAQTGTTSGESEQLIAGDACLREKRKRDVEENSSNKRMLCEAAATLLGSSGGVEGEAAATLLGSSGGVEGEAAAALLGSSGGVEGEAAAALLGFSGEVEGEAAAALLGSSGEVGGEAAAALLGSSGGVEGEAAATLLGSSGGVEGEAAAALLGSSGGVEDEAAATLLGSSGGVEGEVAAALLGSSGVVKSEAAATLLGFSGGVEGEAAAALLGSSGGVGGEAAATLLGSSGGVEGEAAAALLGSSGGVECEAAAALLGSSAAAGKAAASGGFTGNGKASWSSNLTTTEVFNVGGCEKSQSGASASVGTAMSTTNGNGNQQKRKKKSGDQRRKEKKLAGVPKEQLRPSQRQRAKMKIALASSSSNNSKGAPVASSESRAAVSM
jgi:hypothetical protein